MCCSSIDDYDRRCIFDEEEDFNNSDDGRDKEYGFYDADICGFDDLSINPHADNYDDFPIFYDNEDDDF